MEYNLHISCSTLRCFIILSQDDDKILDSFEIDPTKLSEELIISIDNILKKNSININQISSILVDIGPGNNIGIRISILSIVPISILKKIPIKIFSILDISIKNENRILIIKSGKNSIIYIKDNRNQNIYKTNLESLNKLFEKIKLEKSEVIFTNFDLNMEGYKVENIEICPENILKASIKARIFSEENKEIEPITLSDEIF